jgi:hypothetical protein
VLQIDLKVVSSRIEKECIASEPTLDKYLALVRRMENYFKGFIVEHIEINKKTKADELVKVVARSTPFPTDVFFQITKDAIEGEDWQAPIMAYLHNYYEPDNNTELVRMQQREKAYQITNNELYKTSVSSPLVGSLSKADDQGLPLQIHGVCGGHIGARALATKVHRHGFYWPAVIGDVAKLVATCEACNKFYHRSKASAQLSHLITLSWPLQRWGIDIVGKLTPSQGNYTIAIVAIQYFIKWI